LARSNYFYIQIS